MRPDKPNWLPGIIRAHEGAECIYKESGVLCHAKISSIEVDDWGVRAQATPLTTAGLESAWRAPQEPWTFSGVWDIFQCDTATWYFTCITATSVYFDPTLIRKVKTFAEALSGQNVHERSGKLIWHLNWCEAIRQMKDSRRREHWP